jgi:hypothetical protein
MGLTDDGRRHATGFHHKARMLEMDESMSLPTGNNGGLLPLLGCETLLIARANFVTTNAPDSSSWQRNAWSELSTSSVLLLKRAAISVLDAAGSRGARQRVPARGT